MFDRGAWVPRAKDAQAWHASVVGRCAACEGYRSSGWTRTNDLVINSHPLYQLSYRGIPHGTTQREGCQAGSVKKFAIYTDFVSEDRVGGQRVRGCVCD